MQVACAHATVSTRFVDLDDDTRRGYPFYPVVDHVFSCRSKTMSCMGSGREEEDVEGD